MQVSGLASGLDTAGIIKQLMSVERMSGQGLTKGKAKAEGLLGAFQRLNTLVKAMQTAAEAVAPTSVATVSPWTATTGTSTKPELATVNTTGSATPGALTFTVKSVAQAGSAIAGTAMSGTALVNGGAGYSMSITSAKGTTAVTVPANSKLADVAAAINGADAGVRATMVQVAPDQYRLQVESTSTGANSGVSVTGDNLGGFSTLSTAKDTEIVIGDPITGVKVTSPNATLKDVMPGVSITAVKADANTQVTVDIKNDVAGLSSKVQAMVDAANEALGNIRVNSKYDAATKTAGTFNGDSTVRELSSRISNIFVGTSSSSTATLGITLTKDGTIAFDKAKFEAAYAKDPAAVETSVKATATNLNDLGKQATNPTDGMLSVRIQGEQALVKDYTTQLARFEDRMSLRQTTLERQFSALESMLSKLQAQGNWLAGQLKSLPTPSSNND